MKNARERMDIISAYREVGSYRGAAVLCGTSHKTVRRVIAAHEAGEGRPERAVRVRNFDTVIELVTGKVRDTRGRISANTVAAAGAGGRL